MRQLFEQIVDFIHEVYRDRRPPVPLHEPVFCGNEKKYLSECIDSTFVSSVGRFVDMFEEKVAGFTGSPYAVATMNGTAALHAALILAGVEKDTEVVTQAASFVATANAIAYCGATPVFLDSDRDTLGLSPGALQRFLSGACEVRDDGCSYNRNTGRRIAACVPMHVFGHTVTFWSSFSRSGSCSDCATKREGRQVYGFDISPRYGIMANEHLESIRISGSHANLAGRSAARLLCAAHRVRCARARRSRAMVWARRRAGTM